MLVKKQSQPKYCKNYDMTKIEFDFFCFAPLQKNYEINIFYSVFWRNQW